MSSYWTLTNIYTVTYMYTDIKIPLCSSNNYCNQTNQVHTFRNKYNVLCLLGHAVLANDYLIGHEGFGITKL